MEWALRTAKRFIMLRTIHVTAYRSPATERAHMIQRLFWAAIVAGSIAGAAVSLFHMRAAEPLILEAEKYEQAADHADAGATVSEGVASAPTALHHGDDTAWHPDNGFE